MHPIFDAYLFFQLREEYEKQARLKREQQLENLVRSRGEFQINLDASPVFDPYEPPIIPAFAARQPTKPARRSIFQPLTRVQVHQLFMRHSFEVRISLNLVTIAIHSCLLSSCLDPSWTSNSRHFGWIYAFSKWNRWR